MSSDSTNLLMSMVENVCAPVLEQVLDRVELQALREASERLRTENAELRKALQIPRGVFASEQMIASAAESHRARAAAQTPTEAASDVPEQPTGSEPASSSPAQRATFLLWPFAKAPARIRQLAPVRDVPPAWVLMYRRSLGEETDMASNLEQLRCALRTESAPHAPARRRTPGHVLEFIW